MAKCRVCGGQAKETGNAYAPICTSCKVARIREMNRRYYSAHKGEVRARERENRKKNHVVEVMEERRKYVKPSRGIQVVQSGCSCPDTYTKTEFYGWLKAKAFPLGSEYWIDGEKHVVEY